MVDLDEEDYVAKPKKNDDLIALYPPEVIIKYIEDYVTTEIQYTPDGRWANINSEFTSDDKHRMGFNLEENYVNDFKLGGMSLLRFVEEHENMSKVQAEMLLTQIGLKLKKGFKKVKREEIVNRHITAEDCKPLTYLPDIKSFHNPLSSVGERALHYLNSRGIFEKHINKYNLSYSDTKKCSLCHGNGYDEDDDECPMCNGTGINFFYSRVIIPTYEKNNLVYLQGRTINEGTNDLRYQNIKAPRLQVVYFYDLLEEGSDIYITEGPIDAMTLYDYNVTSLLNTKISDPQIEKILKKHPKRIIFVPDYDETSAKRSRVNKAVADNMTKIMKASHFEIPVGIFEWNKMLKDHNREIKKDINAAQITFIDQHYVCMYDQIRLRFAAEEIKRKSVYDLEDD